MKKSKILTILMVLVLMFSLVACSTAKNNDKSQSNNTADISNLMESEPSDLDCESLKCKCRRYFQL